MSVSLLRRTSVGSGPLPPSRRAAPAVEPRGRSAVRATALAWILAAAFFGGCPEPSPCSIDGGSPSDTTDAGGDASDAGLGTVDAGTDPSDAGAHPGDAGHDPSDAGTDPTVAWVLSYFGNDQDLQSDSLHLAYSIDGRRWVELNSGKPIYQLSGWGTNHIRDPFILRLRDGTFVYLATDWTLAQNDSNYWNRPSGKLFMADSKDLITFTNPRLVTVTTLKGPNSSQMHAWAPEAFYDPEKGAYAILWSGNDTTGRNRIYVSYTTDFQAVSDPANPTVYFDPGYTVIDATVIAAGGRNFLLYKDESVGDIQIARSPSSSLAPGVFTRMSPEYVTRGTNQTVGQATEGPFVLKAPDEDVWYLYADHYTRGGQFGGWRTTDLNVAPSGWTAMSSSEYSFPPGVRHANTVRVTQAQLDAIIAHHGVAQTFRLKTTYGEGGASFYVAHSWYHLMITNLNDTSNGQLPGDFRWRAVRGLADPSDPALVSFMPVSVAGRYLRINSKDPSVYPACTTDDPPNQANRGTALCRVPSDQRHHLAWADAYADTGTFRSDATFRKVPALNGDPAMVSFQWYGDATRYLRHAEYQIFATPLSAPPSADATDASFTLEQE